VGTVEILTDPDTKKDMWFPPMAEMWSGPDDPSYCVVRFTTERYNIFIADSCESEVVTGTFKDVEKKTAPLIEPMLTFDRQCEQAIELYQEAFGAKVAMLMRYSDATPQDRPSNCDDEKDLNLIFHAQMTIGSQRILLCDNLFNDLPRGHSVYPVVMFKTDDEVKSAYKVLAGGATIISPPNSTTFSSCCASLIDKFGVHWDLMVY
jgi:PhnB protein